MSWRVVRCVLAHHDQKVRSLDLLVLVYLANHARADDGSGAWPSQRRLAERTGLTDRGIRKILGRLVQAGAVEVEQRPGRTHRFRVRMCAVCLPGPSGNQVPTPTNPPRNVVPVPRNDVPPTPEPRSDESLSIPPREPPSNAVGTSPRSSSSTPTPPAVPESDASAQKKRAAFRQRRYEQIRAEQGQRAADAWLRKVQENDAAEERRAWLDQLASGYSPEGYGGFVPAWALDTWKAMHPNTDLDQGTGT
jgi:hypothetical protein